MKGNWPRVSPRKARRSKRGALPLALPGIFSDQRSNRVLTKMRNCSDAVQAGTPMAVTEEDPSQAERLWRVQICAFFGLEVSPPEAPDLSAGPGRGE